MAKSKSTKATAASKKKPVKPAAKKASASADPKSKQMAALSNKMKRLRGALAAAKSGGKKS